MEKDAILFWDEPEANINPKYIPILVELLIMLENEGVQIFVATHDYFLAKLKDRLIRYRKIWGIEVAVLNPELAKEYKLIT